jgi:hypothetical protein
LLLPVTYGPVDFIEGKAFAANIILNAVNQYRVGAETLFGEPVGYYDYRQRYLATGDALDAQVDAGRISDAAARASLSRGFSVRGGGGGRR